MSGPFPDAGMTTEWTMEQFVDGIVLPYQDVTVTFRPGVSFTLPCATTREIEAVRAMLRWLLDNPGIGEIE